MCQQEFNLISVLQLQKYALYCLANLAGGGGEGGGGGGERGDG